MSLDETPVVGSLGDGGTKGEPRRRSTVPSLWTLRTGRRSEGGGVLALETIGERERERVVN